MKHSRFPRVHPLLTTILVALLVPGCSAPLSRSVPVDNKLERAALETKRAESAKPHFQEIEGQSISIKPLGREKQAAIAREWLSSVYVTLDPAKDSTISAPALMRILRAKGLNVTATMPLDQYTYNGYGVTNVSAETALLVFFGSMGLDYEIDDVQKLIAIQPMKARTWTISVGNRNTSYTNGSSSTAPATSTATSTPASQTTNTGGYGSPQMAPPSTQPAASTSTGSNPGSGTNTISSTDNFWTSLRTEIKDRLTILFPRKANASTQAGQPIVPAISQPIMPQGMGMGMQTSSTPLGESEYYTRQQVGLFSTNPETGAVTVQAPKYVLDSIDKYLSSVQEMYNTSITFEGELVSVTSNDAQHEGIDWSAFSDFAQGTATAVLQNNILGGAIISMAPGSTPSLTLGSPSAVPASNSMFGVVSKKGQFAIFNAFLSSIGQMKIRERPLVATTSGVPVNFGKTTVAYFQQYQQTAAAGGTTGGGATATNTIDVPYTTGIRLRINPRIDVSTGLVRAQITIWRSMVTAWNTKINVITVGNSIQSLPSRTPEISTIDNDGEVLLKNGDMIVLGGLTEDDQDNNDSGVTGLMSSPLRAVTGTAKRQTTTSTYYFALRVTIAKK